MKKTWKTLIIVTALLGTTIFAKSENKDEKYTRQQCIVKVDLLWEYSEQNQIESIIKSIFASFEKTAELSFIDNMPSYVVPWKNRNVLYLQFRNNCEKRIEMAHKFLSEASKRIEKHPSYIVKKDIVEPHPSTIYITGEHWKN